MNTKEKIELGRKPSVIRQLFEYGKLRKKEIGEENVFDYSIGNPSIPAPSIVNDTLINLIKNKPSILLHGYTSAVGDFDVKKAICDYLKKVYNAHLNPHLMYLTVGAAASLTIAINAICEKDDEVIVFKPYFPEYRVFIEGALAKVVEVGHDEKFMPNFEMLEKAITPKTKLVIINSPNNPTGTVYGEKEIKKLADVLKKYSNKYNHPIYLLSDEPYRELIFDNLEYPFVTNYYDNSLVCYSFSKSLSIPGERIGYLVVSEKASNANELYLAVCGAARMLGFVCAPSIFQYMIPYCLGYTSDLKIYKKNRDLLYNALIKIGYEVVYPAGAFYLFVKALEDDANCFSDVAKKYELLLVPSDSFGVKGYVRISYCVSEKQIVNSIPAFEKLYKEYEG